jgi:hypothetical protein
MDAGPQNRVSATVRPWDSCRTSSREADSREAAAVREDDAVHSAQGITIGRGHALEWCPLIWDAKMKSRWPGIFYVGANRVKPPHHKFCIRRPSFAHRLLQNFGSRAPFLRRGPPRTALTCRRAAPPGERRIGASERFQSASILFLPFPPPEQLQSGHSTPSKMAAAGCHINAIVI